MTAQQTLKIKELGLESYVDAVVISEVAGVKKPDPQIYRIAGMRLGLTSPASMIGDHPIADIEAAHALGLKTGWVSRGSKWAEESFSPTIIRETAAEAINEVVLRGNSN